MLSAINTRPLHSLVSPVANNQGLGNKEPRK